MRRSISFTIDDSQRFEAKLRNASKVLYLADNVGEVYFDLPLVKKMRQFADVIYVVKPLPVQNDATLEDISHAGLESDFGKVITTGVASPGMIYIDLSFDEPLCIKPTYRKVLTDPFPNEERKIQVYALEELLAEKMRSLLERGKSRDYYDVWRLLKEHFSQLNLELLGKVLPKKLAHKGLYLQSMSDFLPKESKGLKRYWENDLQQQVDSLSPLEEVLGELRDMFDKLVAPHISLLCNDP
ncbi:MAG: nucleotidyl transferase AbiEii/AbiGii toxin family protein [Dehalococcoidia bacterium]|nr:nucleotidyl transferase AbiEii/AbiGii toxin family protein [Dehalococcoidia bacterium]MDH5781561.1 nucleotidyl transferase AbiEii/AbiGii toxin family protein [Dehalococcoidia bacterium]